MEEFFTRVSQDLIARVSGPLQFRLVLQPAMAVFFAVRAGLHDAAEKRPAYFWAIFTDKAQRKDLLKEGWKAIGKVFVIAMIVDSIYQFMVLRWLYPGEALIVAVILSVVPYLLIRGPVNRVARLIHKRAVPQM
jgi:hypothetical protein